MGKRGKKISDATATHVAGYTSHVLHIGREIYAAQTYICVCSLHVWQEPDSVLLFQEDGKKKHYIIQIEYNSLLRYKYEMVCVVVYLRRHWRFTADGVLMAFFLSAFIRVDNNGQRRVLTYKRIDIFFQSRVYIFFLSTIVKCWEGRLHGTMSETRQFQRITPPPSKNGRVERKKSPSTFW